MGEAGSRTVKLTRAEEQRAEELYNIGWRQVRRWKEKGAPLFKPAKMPAWWSTVSKWPVPEGIQRAAIAAARSETPTDAAPSSASGETETAAASKSRTPASTSPPAEPGKSINLEDFDPEEGDRLRELKQLQAAKFRELTEKLKAGTATGIDESKYLALCETVDKIETRVTERLKKRGLYILRDAVDRDNAAAAEFLRQSRTSMSRKVLELCSSLDNNQRTEVAAAIERVGAQQERIIARLSTFQNSDDLLRELNAA